MNEILEFLDNWFKKNGTIDSTDTSKLSQFMSEFGAEIDKLSVVPPEGASKLILYGGWNGDVPMWRIAEGASKSGKGYYFISSTEAGEILNDGLLRERIDDICGSNEDLINRIYGNQVNGVRSAYVVDGQLAINDRISYNLAKNASGNVTIWAPNGIINSYLSI